MGATSGTGADPRIELDVKKIREEAEEKSLQRYVDIDAASKRFAGNVRNMEELKSKAMAERWTADQFNSAILEAWTKQKPIETESDDSTKDNLLGMSDKDLESYSLVRAMRQIGLEGKLDGIELEASVAASKLYKRESAGGKFGFIVPHDVAFQKRRFGQRVLSTSLVPSSIQLQAEQQPGSNP